MKILATGAAGMLGTSLVPIFTAACHDVVATDIDLTNPKPWGTEGPGLEHLDVRERPALVDAFDEVAPEFVLHLAAETSLETCLATRPSATPPVTPQQTVNPSTGSGSSS